MSSKNTTEPSTEAKTERNTKLKIIRVPSLKLMLYRHDILAWLLGMLFLTCMMAAMMVAGSKAGWNATSGYKHYNSSSSLRLMPEPEYCNETNIKGRHGNGCTGRWYYWKLPLDKITPLSTAIIWLCYSAHQISLWITIFLAQSNKMKNCRETQKFGTKLHWYNWTLLTINALFFLIHLGQTHWTYDGLAQNVALASSEGSVILVLGLILVLEYKDRGFMFLWPTKLSSDSIAKRIRPNYEPIKIVRKYHGYLICWATTYTFWYHPMENTWGHVLGFIHGGMLFLQGSLIYTRFHLNRYWRLLNEIWVIIHGSFMAFQTRHGEVEARQQWPLYFLGFGLILSCTQIFGLTFWRKIHFAFRAIPPLLFFVISLILCGTEVIRGNAPGESSFARLREIFYIPLEMYLILIAIWLLIYLMLKLEKHVIDDSDSSYNVTNLGVGETEVTVISNENIVNEERSTNTSNRTNENSTEDICTDAQDIDEEEQHNSSILKQALGITGFLLIHAIMIVLSYFIQWMDVNMSNSNIMFIMVAIFTVCWSIAAMMARLALNSVK
ncbi:uncharacterized protein LOC120337714 isoform X2 [Styela clava]